MYISRHVEKEIERSFEAFPVLLVTGPRQAGKSTLLLNRFKNIPNVTLDNPWQLTSLKEDPVGFFKAHGTPLVLDEIQRAPECFSVIKYMVDSDHRAGMYILTGSQKYVHMKGVSESLAGRIGIIDMLGLSNREINGDSFELPFLPTADYLHNRRPQEAPSFSGLWERIHRGSMPELYSNKKMNWDKYYASYLNSYIERDVKQLASIGDDLAFAKFMTCLASRTGELLNEASLARDVEVDSKTIKRWLSILQASNIVYLLYPFSLNINKRIIKTPKVYFTDTGLVCYLCRWLTPETLANGSMAGNIYETFVVSEIIKSYYNAGMRPDIYFFRNTDGQEVDLLFYRDGKLYPIEIKKTFSPNIKDVRHFKTLSTFFPSIEVSEGGIICNAEELLPLGNNIKIIPVHYI